MQKEKEFLREEIDHLKRRAADKQQETDIAERALAQYHASDVEAQKQIFLGVRSTYVCTHTLTHTHTHTHTHLCMQTAASGDLSLHRGPHILYISLSLHRRPHTQTHTCIHTAAKEDLSQALAESREQVSKMAEQNCRLLNELSPARQKVCACFCLAGESDCTTCALVPGSSLWHLPKRCGLPRGNHEP